MTKLYVISDCHGNYDGLIRALLKKKIIDSKTCTRQLGRRHKVFSIGDLANCVDDSVEGDLACLHLVGNVIDGMLVGNHEIPYIDPDNKFQGFIWNELVSDKIQSLLASDLIGPSVVAGKILISHAGVSQHFVARSETALDWHKRLEEHWSSYNYAYSMFSNVGKARFGPHAFGGALWCDFDEEFIPTDFPQIVGHTPKYVRMKGNAICIDVGAKDQDTEPFILEVS